jgi:hypothetical protein
MINSIINSFQNFLSDNFKMETSELYEYCNEIQDEIYVTMRKDIKKKIEKLYENAISNFKKDFFYEEGIPRIWNKIEESQIDKLFILNREKHFQTFNIFRKLTLTRYPIECIIYIYLDKDKKINFDDIEKEDLLSEQDIGFMKKRYEDGINEILEDAKRRHVILNNFRQI